jgi:hypothetical protein
VFEFKKKSTKQAVLEPDKYRPPSNTSSKMMSEAPIDFPLTTVWGDIDPNNPTLNLYEQVKARFEKECFKVKNPFCYVHITEEKKLVSI